MRDRVWHLLTGEYPPTPGGVADYTRVLARALVEAGDRVVVWAPAPRSGSPAQDTGIEVRALPAVSPVHLEALARAVIGDPTQRLIVQYVPHAFGWRAVNVPLCAWLAARLRGRMWVMFHEVAFPWTGPLRHRAVSAATHVMAALLAGSAGQTFVSTMAWSRGVTRLDLRGRPPVWLPAGTNLPTSVPADEVASARRALGFDGLIVSHFGTYGTWFRQVLGDLIPALLRGPGRRFVLLGRRGAKFKEELVRTTPGLIDRLCAPAVEEPEALAAFLAASDVVLQPYPDGVSTRRTTAMAAMALGRPLVTNDGFLTDPIWRGGDVALAAGPEQLLPALEQLLEQSEGRAELGARAKRLYFTWFDVQRSVEVLQRLADSSEWRT